MATRQEQKQQTRRALFDAALSFVAESRSFSSISLREVAKRAGVVPTSFYRHFKDMEELGLLLVDKTSTALRRLMREARINDDPTTEMIRISVKIYMDFMLADRPLFQFAHQEQYSASPVIRNALRSEYRFFVHELAQDLKRFNIIKDITDEDADMVCSLVITAVLSMNHDLLEVEPGDKTAYLELEERTTKKLRLILLGSMQWKSKPNK